MSENRSPVPNPKRKTWERSFHPGKMRWRHAVTSVGVKNHHPKQNRACSEICTAISYKQPIEFNVTNDKDLEYIMSLTNQVL